MRHFILASASPQRKRLLSELSRNFDVIPADVDETLPAGISPAEAAAHVARRKAEKAARIAEGRGLEGVVVAADTIVLAGSENPEVIGKPDDDEHAVAILGKLSGSRHTIVTGLCVFDMASGKIELGWDETRVTMATMTDAQIREYVASGESRGKAGAYGFQEEGDPYVKEVDGSFSNVLGLPLELLREFLRRIAGKTR
jgi:septum formation protein